MTDVLLFSKAHVVIEAGTITGCDDPRRIGEPVFFVEYHDDAGGVLHAYSGTSHAAAVKSAQAWAVPVFDRTTQGTGH